ncbi:hypothetical protein DRH14_00795 [Candidatus Shapirobacteria bacterium]|nr:MAG: hypothetical protein DRH14_00795 [Candidatus Shapirobacteria bacterium]
MATIKKPKRILMITPFFSPNIGGVEKHLDDLCSYLSQKGHQITVLTYQPLTSPTKASSFQKTNNLSIYRFNWPGYQLFHRLQKYPTFQFLYITPYLFFRSFVFLLFRPQKFDLIHAHGLNASFIAMLLKNIFKIPFVASTYAIYNFKKKSLFSRLSLLALSSAQKVLALAQPSTRELIRIGLNKQKITTYFLWIDKRLYKKTNRNQARQQLKLANKFTAIFVGRLIASKGIAIIKKLIKTFPDINFIVIGDHSQFEPDMEQIAVNHQNLHLYCGSISIKKLSLYYSSANLLLMPSLHPEAFGKVAIEALACGTPVLASNRGALSCILSKSVSVVVNPTFSNFKQQLNFLRHHPSKLRNMSQKAPAYVQQNFSPHQAKVIEQAYYFN